MYAEAKHIEELENKGEKHLKLTYVDIQTLPELWDDHFMPSWNNLRRLNGELAKVLLKWLNLLAVGS